MSATETRVPHTPGPWTICYDGEIDGSDGRAVCFFRWESFKEFKEGNNAANARLIAAAPDLLTACEEINGWDMSSLPQMPDWYPALRAAIAKAKGQQP